MRVMSLLVLVVGCSGETTPEQNPDSGGKSDDTCLAQTEACTSSDQCCDDLDCATTTLGQVCCGQQGASCTTANGEDCCGSLLCIDGICALPDSMFAAPFPCNQSWTFSHHSAEVRMALDFIRDGGGTDGEAVLASAGGTAFQRFETGGAGNYIVIEHGGGWTTYYFHLSAFSVADGSPVARGQEVGRVGSTGASSGPHLHYEQLLHGVGQPIVIAGQELSPYPSNYGERSITSANGCP
jgi:hypothetical protein